MKDRNGKQTACASVEKQKPGPKPSGKALTNAQRQRNHRARVKAKLEAYSLICEQSGPSLPHPSKIDRFED